MTNERDDWHVELAKRSEEAALAFAELVKTIGRLRHPTSGCPWDLEQSHETLRRYMIEEAYEAAEAMAEKGYPNVADELGDVLLQVVLNAQIAHDEGRFNVIDVVRAITEKMLRRHPHVFAPEETVQPKNFADLHSQWAAIKAKEKGQAASQPKGLFAEAEKGVYPATLQAKKIGKIAEKIGFDWDDVVPVVAQLKSEVEELSQEIHAARRDDRAIEQEIGDVFFTLAQVCRHLGVDPEVAALAGNHKFLRRFALLESLARTKGIDLEAADMDTKEALWQEAKAEQKRAGM